MNKLELFIDFNGAIGAQFIQLFGNTLKTG